MASASPEDVSNVTFRCPMCDWLGKGADAADREQGDVLRCPACWEPLVREEE